MAFFFYTGGFASRTHQQGTSFPAPYLYFICLLYIGILSCFIILFLIRWVTPRLNYSLSIFQTKFEKYMWGFGGVQLPQKNLPQKKPKNFFKKNV